MTNRDKLLKSSEYDVLLRMNDNLRAFNSSCVMIGLIGYDKKVTRCYEYKCKCDQCIQSFLNEEAQ